MSRKVRWGIIGAADIALRHVIPAMQKGEHSEITAVASRDIKKARAAADSLGIPKAYGSYDEMLADPEIDAVYNPLPNHLHLPWSVKAAEAGKHVLLEKPLTMDTKEALELVKTRDRTGVMIQEAFMIRAHPQWNRIREIIKSGKIGKVRSVMAYFHYNNTDKDNVRNIQGYGGGGLLDIGCYLIYSSRIVYGYDPVRVMGTIRRDPQFQTDMLTSAILDYSVQEGHAVFTCSTQAVSNQRMHIFGTEGRLEIEIPYFMPPETTSRLYIDDGSKLPNREPEIIETGPLNQYTLQGDSFSKAILDNTRQLIPLETSVMNMAVIGAVFKSAQTGCWVKPTEILRKAREEN